MSESGEELVSNELIEEDVVHNHNSSKKLKTNSATSVNASSSSEINAPPLSERLPNSNSRRDAIAASTPLQPPNSLGRIFDGFPLLDPTNSSTTNIQGSQSLEVQISNPTSQRVTRAKSQGKKKAAPKPTTSKRPKSKKGSSNEDRQNDDDAFLDEQIRIAASEPLRSPSPPPVRSPLRELGRSPIKTLRKRKQDEADTEAIKAAISLQSLARDNEIAKETIARREQPLQENIPPYEDPNFVPDTLVTVFTQDLAPGASSDEKLQALVDERDLAAIEAQQLIPRKQVGDIQIPILPLSYERLVKRIRIFRFPNIPPKSFILPPERVDQAKLERVKSGSSDVSMWDSREDAKQGKTTKYVIYDNPRVPEGPTKDQLEEAYLEAREDWSPQKALEITTRSYRITERSFLQITEANSIVELDERLAQGIFNEFSFDKKKIFITTY